MFVSLDNCKMTVGHYEATTEHIIEETLAQGRARRLTEVAQEDCSNANHIKPCCSSRQRSSLMKYVTCCWRRTSLQGTRPLRHVTPLERLTETVVWRLRPERTKMNANSVLRGVGKV